MTTEEKIRLARLEKGFSQENMADMLGISTTAYGDLERGKTEMTVNRLQKVAEILNLQVVDFLALPVEVVPLQNELLLLEIDKLKAEKERFELEALHWREKYEEKILQDAYQILLARQEQANRQQIGFKRLAAS